MGPDRVLNPSINQSINNQRPATTVYMILPRVDDDAIAIKDGAVMRGTSTH